MQRAAQRRQTPRSWSVVESHRYAGGKIAPRDVLYLGEINDSQRLAGERSLAVFDEPSGETRQLAFVPSERTPSADGTLGVQVRLDALRLEHPRLWGACWLADQLWRTLHLDDFSVPDYPSVARTRTGKKVLRVLVIYRALAPGSEWRLHRHWFSTTVLPDLLGPDARAAQDDTLYRYHELRLPHKEGLFTHRRQRWSELCDARYEVLLYDLTSTYFECDVPADADDPRRFGHSRDRSHYACKSSSPESSRPKACLWPTRCCRATPPTKPPCATRRSLPPAHRAKPGRRAVAVRHRHYYPPPRRKPSHQIGSSGLREPQTP